MIETMSGELSASIGRRARALRVENGLSQEKLALRVREYGLNWGTSRVSEMERGELALDLSTLLVVVAALNTAGETTTFHTLASLIEDDVVPVSSRWSMPLSAVVSLISGVGLPEQPAGVLDPDAKRVRYDLDRMISLLTHSPPEMRGSDGREARSRPTSLAERRAARRLEVDPALIKVWAAHLWGMSLDEKAAAVSQGGSAQSRGHATRGLVAELDAQIPSGARGAYGETDG